VRREITGTILTRELIGRIFIVSTLLLVGAFGLFEWELMHGADIAEARTVAVNVFVMVQLFYLFNCRSLTKSIFRLGFFSNPLGVGWSGDHARPAAALHLSAGDELDVS